MPVVYARGERGERTPIEISAEAWQELTGMPADSGEALVKPDFPYPRPGDYPLLSLRDMGSMALDFVPGVGDLKSGQEAITGKDLVTGEKLNWWQRGLAGVGALPLVPNLAPYLGMIPAWHGSPHKFDKFSLEKVGTGEGAQAFGHGLYFTSEQEIAKYYAKGGAAKQLHEMMNVLDVERREEVGNLLRQRVFNRGDSLTGSEREIALRDIAYYEGGQQGFPSWLKTQPHSISMDDVLAKYARQPQEHIYSVTLHKGKKPGEYDYLKWDEATTDTNLRKLQRQLHKEFAGNPILEELSPFFYQKQRTGENLTGQTMYSVTSRFLGGDRRASEFFLRAGIDGIEYPAGTLSGAKSTAKNYVVFDENAITIEK